jgi:hypothetical protein
MEFWRRLTGKPTKDEFANLMIRRLRDVGERRAIGYDSGEFSLEIGSELRVFLGNAFAEYSAASRGTRDAILARYAHSATDASIQLPGEYEEALPRLLPSVRASAYHGLNQLRAHGTGMTSPRQTPYLPMASHLAISLVYDTPRTIRSISEADLSSWGTSFEETLGQAKDNLMGISAERFETLASGVYRSPWRDNHDASRLALTELIWTMDVEGDYVAAVPDRDTLLITGSQDLVGLEYIAQCCESALQDARAVSGIPVLFRDRRWVSFLPEPDHPLCERFTAIRVTEQSSHYAEQKELLDKLNENAKTDEFVASYTAVRNNETGITSSYCVWCEGITTLLPQADEVAFVQEGGPVLGRCDWQRVVEEFGNLMTPVDVEPGRFRVDEFPPLEGLALLLDPGLPAKALPPR